MAKKYFYVEEILLSHMSLPRINFLGEQGYKLIKEEPFVSDSGIVKTRILMEKITWQLKD